MKELLRIIYVFVNHREVIFNDESGHVSSVASWVKAIAWNIGCCDCWWAFYGLRIDSRIMEWKTLEGCKTTEDIRLCDKNYSIKDGGDACSGHTVPWLRADQSVNLPLIVSCLAHLFYVPQWKSLRICESQISQHGSHCPPTHSPREQTWL